VLAPDAETPPVVDTKVGALARSQDGVDPPPAVGEVEARGSQQFQRYPRCPGGARRLHRRDVGGDGELVLLRRDPDGPRLAKASHESAGFLEEREE